MCHKNNCSLLWSLLWMKWSLTCGNLGFNQEDYPNVVHSRLPLSPFPPASSYQLIKGIHCFAKTSLLLLPSAVIRVILWNMANFNQVQNKSELHSQSDLEMGPIAIASDAQFMVLSVASIHSLWIHPSVLLYVHFPFRQMFDQTSPKSLRMNFRIFFKRI